VASSVVAEVTSVAGSVVSDATSAVGSVVSQVTSALPVVGTAVSEVQSAAGAVTDAASDVVSEAACTLAPALCAGEFILLIVLGESSLTMPSRSFEFVCSGKTCAFLSSLSFSPFRKLTPIFSS
jgi:hypothetical protein